MQTQAGKSVQGDSTPGSSSSLSFDLDFVNLHSVHQLDSMDTSGGVHSAHKDIDLLDQLPNSTTLATTHDTTTKSQMIKSFPPTMQFANTRTIIFNTPESSSGASSATPSSYCTPSSESFTSFHWAPDALSNPDTLAPTVPDLTLSFIESTNWRSATPVRNSNNVSTTTDALKQSRNNNPDSTPTREYKHKFNSSVDDNDDNDEEEKEDADYGKGKSGCFSTSATPRSLPLEKRFQTTKDGSSEEQQWPQRAQSRPLSQMTFGTVGSGMMMTTMSEKSRPKPKKTFGFTIRTGRIRSSTCLENQLEDVLNQQYSPAFAEHEQTAIYRLPQSEPPRTGGHYQKAKNRFSAFLSPGKTTDHRASPADLHPTPDSRRASSANILDRSTLSFSSPSFRTFNSSATDDTHPSNTTRPLLSALTILQSSTLPPVVIVSSSFSSSNHN
ncbi:hypothetical protein PSHT_09704 [Puccinia striiformis]|uniref:Uncharacterized protein n=1 Tax=Puccinia striiformis TaxID=27350 RepID=A0A2S4VEY4_9BASI|nr:hypothetical protein PSHT_09704 [Puccinia striiformis]